MTKNKTHYIIIAVLIIAIALIVISRKGEAPRVTLDTRDMISQSDQPSLPELFGDESTSNIVFDTRTAERTGAGRTDVIKVAHQVFPSGTSLDYLIFYRRNTDQSMEQIGRVYLGNNVSIKDIVVREGTGDMYAVDVIMNKTVTASVINGQLDYSNITIK